MTLTTRMSVIALAILAEAGQAFLRQFGRFLY